MEIDARKLSCPAPVLLAKEAVEKNHPDSIDILVDNEAAKQNVSRFLQSRSYQVQAHEETGGFRILGVHLKAAGKQDEIPQSSSGEDKKILVMIATDRIGFGDDTLGIMLMTNFIKTLNEMVPDLWKMVFVNNGVKLTVSGSPVISELKELAGNGVDIMVCGTCLSHFNLLDKKEVGGITNMLDIVTAMQLADKVITV